MSQFDSVCSYVDTYTNVDTQEEIDYECEQPELTSSGLCMFHDPDFLTPQTEDRVRIEFDTIVEYAEQQVKILECIGFYLPAVSIHNLNFRAQAYFVNTKFQGDLDLFDVKFTSVSFLNSRFFKVNSFYGVEIKGKLIFSDIIFNDSPCTFQNVSISQNSNFSRTQFFTLLVGACTFSSSVFRRTIFNNQTTFLKTIFSNETDFVGSEFRGESDFTHSTFNKNCDFRFAKFNNVTKFHIVDFKEQKLVIFDGDLSNVSFMDTDITRIKFDEGIVWGKSDKYEIYDARELKKTPEKNNLDYVLSIYRNLRENYEFRLMYEEAGQFFVKEMELKRIYFQDPNDNYKTKVKKWKQYFSLTNCYNVLCQYGESFKRVSLWAILLFFSAFVYFCSYPDINALNQSKPLGEIDYAAKIASDPLYRLEISIERSLASFFQINRDSLADHIIRIFSLPILGTLFIVLRRRFERRFRH